MNKELNRAITSHEEMNLVWPRTILAGYRGSVAHGTADGETDDIDILGVYIAPKEHYYGFTKLPHVTTSDTMLLGKYDFCMYEVRKFVDLCLKGNPSVLTLLFTPGHLQIETTSMGSYLVCHRHMFLSKKLFKTFGGYAAGQRKKMMSPCGDKSFMGAARRERFEKFGYDCKNASHLIRLLRMVCEVLETGEMLIERPDAQHLLAIKQGKWLLNSVLAETNHLERRMNRALLLTRLPDEPNRVKVEKILCEIIEDSLADYS